MFPVFNVLLYLKERKVNGKGHFSKHQRETGTYSTNRHRGKSILSIECNRSLFVLLPS